MTYPPEPPDAAAACPPYRRAGLLEYAAVLRPTVVLGLVVVLLPLTAAVGVPGSTMLGNLFVEYGFREAFWFACPLLASAWALMVTAGLTLDAARAAGAFPDPGVERRRLTIPLRGAWLFVAFTLLALPGAIVVVRHAESPLAAAAGFVAGGLVTYAVNDALVSLIRLADWRLRVLPWEPLLCRLLLATLDARRIRLIAFVPDRFIAMTSWLARWVPLPRHFFVACEARRTLDGDHVFLAWNLALMAAIYVSLYVVLGPDGPLAGSLDRLPPAGFVYLLVVLLVLLVSLPWILLGRYRVLGYAFAVWLVGTSALHSSHLTAAGLGTRLFGRAAHTYDVYPMGDRPPLDTLDVLAPLAADGPDGTLVVVAASGGGILAAGWTTKVLAELSLAYPRLRRELRLVSAVSGGSVGTVHFVRAQPSDGSALDAERLAEIVEHSTMTSLGATAYGFVFPDLHRVLLPFLVPEIDRGRLQEARWQRTAACGQPAPPSPELLADWNEDVRRGTKPAVVLNATVLETGERIAITPLVSLRQVSADAAGRNSGWPGAFSRDGDEALPVRRNGTRTLAEFLDAPRRHTIGVWTAARLSATFSYVSPPARARICTAPGRCADQEGLDARWAPLHLIDGGYHDNYGVASALEWITRVVRHCEDHQGACPFRRIALVEIRAKPVSARERPDPEWKAAWFGPPAGIMNSWAFAQTAANDVAIDRLIHELQRSPTDIQLDAFVFQPPAFRCLAAPGADAASRCCCGTCCPRERREAVDDFPLSWHLSRSQTGRLADYWRSAENQQTLRSFLRFVGAPAVERSGPDGALCCHPIQHLPAFRRTRRCPADAPVTVAARPDAAIR